MQDTGARSSVLRRERRDSAPTALTRGHGL